MSLLAWLLLVAVVTYSPRTFVVWGVCVGLYAVWWLAHFA